MLFVLEIFGWVILMIITIALYVLAGVVVIIAGMLVSKLLWHIFKPVFETLRKNIHLNAPRLKTGRKKKLEFYEDYSRFR